MSLLDLARYKDIIIHILAPKLDVISLSRLCCVCTRFNELIGKKKVLCKWRERKFGSVGWHGNGCMVEAALQNDIPLVHLFIARGAYCWNPGLHIAVEAQNTELIDLFLEKEGVDVNFGLWGAASAGSIEWIEFFIAKGANDFGSAFQHAAKKGHLHVVKHLIKKGGNWKKGMRLAIENDLVDIVIYLSTFAQKISDLNDFLWRASECNRVEVISLLIEKGATDLNGALIRAVFYNHIESVRVLVKHGADNIAEVVEKYGRACGEAIFNLLTERLLALQRE